jgi:hypothetical protein
MTNEPLTVEEIYLLGEDALYEVIIVGGEHGHFSMPDFSVALARAVEQAHGIGNRQ